MNPLFPTMASYPWEGFDPADNTSKDIPIYEHAQVIDQDYITSWNNEEAPGYSGADDLTNHTSVWRSIASKDLPPNVPALWTFVVTSATSP